MNRINVCEYSASPQPLLVHMILFKIDHAFKNFFNRLIGLKYESPSTVSTNTSTPQSVNNMVHYLASALLQIQQGIERRFLKAPLGKCLSPLY